MYFDCKVKKILKGSLDLISSTSPSVKIQIIGGKFCLRCEGKTFLFSKVCWHHPSMFCLITFSKLSPNNLNFHWRWRWWDRFNAISLNLYYFTYVLLIPCKIINEAQFSSSQNEQRNCLCIKSGIFLWRWVENAYWNFPSYIGWMPVSNYSLCMFQYFLTRNVF